MKMVSQNWFSFVQSIPITVNIKTKFYLQASVRIVQDTPKSVITLWVRIDNKNGDIGFFDNMKNRSIKFDQWQSLVIEGVLDESSSVINFGGLCKHKGAFYFKDFKLFITNKQNVLEEVAIKNVNFENIHNCKEIPGWYSGTGRETPNNIRGYELKSIVDKETKSPCLLIEGKDVFDIEKDYTEHIGILIFMLQDIGNRMKKTIQNLNVDELDYLPDDNINSIGATIMHITASEAYYQNYTFEQREFNVLEKQKWQIAIDMGEKAQDSYQGYPVEYYLEAYEDVREKTLLFFRNIEDSWLKDKSLESNLNNHYNWLHVMEHQSYHLGQIVMLKKLMY